MSLLDTIRDVLARSLAEGDEAKEDPALSVRRILGDLRRSLSEARAMVAVTMRDLRGIERQILVAEREEGRWHGNARQALGVGREDLAREALNRKVAARRHRDDLRRELEKLKHSLEAAKRVVFDLERAFKEARTRERVLIAQRRRIRQAEYLRKRFPERARQLLRAAMDELEDDVGRQAITATLEHDPLEMKLLEHERQRGVVDDELVKLRDELDGDRCETSADEEA